MNSKERIIEISRQEGLTHLSSTISAVDAIEAIFQVKEPDERFVLSNGHAALALYVVMEKRGLVDPVQAIRKDIHANSEFCDVSTGSLGQGLPIAVGMAIAQREKRVFCMVSDGEMAEGSIWEALRVAQEQRLDNLKVVVNANGWAAYRKTDIELLLRQLRGFVDTVSEVDGHDVEAVKWILDTTTEGPHIVLAHTSNEPYPDDLSSHYMKA
jgi:transketolase